MSTKVPFKFEEFYDAFSRSVASDTIFTDGQREKEPPIDSPRTILPTINSEGQIKKHAKGRLLDSADRRRLPWSIRALLEAQEPDGSWMYSSSFEFIINGTAPPPMEGISSKLWATAIAITIWRQFPEYFELLETYYEKAMLHVDENVLRIVRTVLQFDALDHIRPYKSDEARAIREQLAREAAAKREQELDEEMKIARAREEEVRIGKLSRVHARRLPMPIQQLFVAELGNELAKVFSTSLPVLTSSIQSLSNLKVGQLVESCRRRRANGSPPRWHRCRIAAIDQVNRVLQLDFLDGDCESERRVPVKFVRATLAGAQEDRAAQFEALKGSWSQPIVCKAEIARLEEARASNLKPLPWDPRHHLMLQDPTREEDERTQDGALTPASTGRPCSSARWLTSREKSRENPSRSFDSLFHAAAIMLVQYDRAYAGVQAAMQSGARRYASAVLYRERFHAFDELAEVLVLLVERTVDALDAICRWKQSSSSASPESPKTFVWKGDDFIATLVRSLDFLGDFPELTEWYGEEFPLDGNPFMRSTSLLDKARECGLQPAVNQQQTASSASTLRATLKLHKRSDNSVASSSPPTWWPQARYSMEFLQRIEQAEQRLLQELLALRWLEKRRVDQTVGHGEIFSSR